MLVFGIQLTICTMNPMQNWVNEGKDSISLGPSSHCGNQVKGRAKGLPNFRKWFLALLSRTRSPQITPTAIRNTWKAASIHAEQVRASRSVSASIPPRRWRRLVPFGEHATKTNRKRAGVSLACYDSRRPPLSGN